MGLEERLYQDFFLADAYLSDDTGERTVKPLRYVYFSEGYQTRSFSALFGV
jgi:hypothetical protein